MMAFTQKLINITFTLADKTSTTLTGLRVSAKIVMAGGESSGQLECAIYGMTLSMMNQLSTVGTQLYLQNQNSITVSAGDASGMSVVFQGTIFWAFFDGDVQPNVAFRVSAFGGLIQVIQPIPATSINGTADVATTMQTIAQQMGLQFENNNVQVKLSCPYFPGSGLEQARKCANAAGILMIVDRGTLVITPRGVPRRGASTLVSPQTGMRGYPKFNQAFVIVSQEFTATIKPYGRITIQSQLTPACGDWMIYNLEYDLESMVYNGKWFATMTCGNIDITPPPPS